MEIDYLEDLEVNGRIILKFMYKNLDRQTLTGFIWLLTGAGAGRLCIR